MKGLVAKLLLTLLSAATAAVPQDQPAPIPGVRGDYLGQPAPDAQPRLFAPGIVSTGRYDRDIAMPPDGSEIFFSVAGPGYAWMTILATRRLADGRWTQPEVAPFTAPLPATDIEPFVAPDGKRLYFVSDRPRSGAGAPADHDIWVVDRSADGWGAPHSLGAPVDSEDEEYFPSLTRDGTLYFTREKRGERSGFVYRSRLVDGRHAEPERLPDAVNAGTARFNAFVAPDESYLILSIMGLPDAIGRTDYYVCFRDRDDTWSAPINLGPAVNVKGGEGYSPYVTPDGRYFFFMSRRRGALEALAGKHLDQALLERLGGMPENGNTDTYWVEASFIEKLRPRPRN